MGNKKKVKLFKIIESLFKESKALWANIVCVSGRLIYY